MRLQHRALLYGHKRILSYGGNRANNAQSLIKFLANAELFDRMCQPKGKASGRGRAALKVRCPAIMKPQSERAKMPLQLIATKCSAKWNKQEQVGQTISEDLQTI